MTELLQVNDKAARCEHVQHVHQHLFGDADVHAAGLADDVVRTWLASMPGTGPAADAVLQLAEALPAGFGGDSDDEDALAVDAPSDISSAAPATAAAAAAAAAPMGTAKPCVPPAWVGAVEMAAQQLLKPLLVLYEDELQRTRLTAVACITRCLLVMPGNVVRTLPYLWPAFVSRISQAWGYDFTHHTFVADQAVHDATLRGRLVGFTPGAVDNAQGVHSAVNAAVADATLGGGASAGRGQRGAVGLMAGGAAGGMSRGGGAHPLSEPSEQVRAALAVQLHVLLRATYTMGSMSSISGYMQEIILASHALLRDPAPDTQLYTAQHIIILLCSAAPTVLQHFAIGFARSLGECLALRYAHLRVAMLRALQAVVAVPSTTKIKGAGTEAIMDLVGHREENVIPIRAFYGDDTRVNMFAQLAADPSAAVRLAFVDCLAAWLLRLPDRTDHEARLLPYLLSALGDDAQQVRQRALEHLAVLGRQYDAEHADKLVDRKQYGVDGDARVNHDQPLPAPFTRRLSLGTRCLVRGNATRFIKPLLNELADWKTSVRAPAARLLVTVMVALEERITQHADGFTRLLLRMQREPDLQLAGMTVAALFGRYVDPDVWVPLLCELLGSALAADDADTAPLTRAVGVESPAEAVGLALCVLHMLVTAAQPSRLAAHLAKLTQLLASPSLHQLLREHPANAAVPEAHYRVYIPDSVAAPTEPGRLPMRAEDWLAAKSHGGDRLAWGVALALRSTWRCLHTLGGGLAGAVFDGTGRLPSLPRLQQPILQTAATCAYSWSHVPAPQHELGSAWGAVLPSACLPSWVACQVTYRANSLSELSPAHQALVCLLQDSEAPLLGTDEVQQLAWPSALAAATGLPGVEPLHVLAGTALLLGSITPEAAAALSGVAHARLADTPDAALELAVVALGSLYVSEKLPDSAADVVAACSAGVLGVVPEGVVAGGPAVAPMPAPGAAEDSSDDEFDDWVAVGDTPASADEPEQQQALPPQAATAGAVLCLCAAAGTAGIARSSAVYHQLQSAASAQCTPDLPGPAKVQLLREVCSLPSSAVHISDASARALLQSFFSLTEADRRCAGASAIEQALAQLVSVRQDVAWPSCEQLGLGEDSSARCHAQRVIATLQKC